MCIADDTKWLFFRIVPPPSAGEQYTTKLGYRKRTEGDRSCLRSRNLENTVLMWTKDLHGA